MEVGSDKPASPSRILSWPASLRLLLERFDDSGGFLSGPVSLQGSVGWLCAEWVLLLLLLPYPSNFQGLVSFDRSH